MKSIGSRLMLYFSVTILIIGVGLGIIAYNEACDALRNNARSSLEELAAKAATIVIRDCDNDIILMDMIANRNEIKSMDWETQLPVLQEETARHGFLTMGIVNPDGNARYIDQEEQTFLGDRDYVVKAFNGEVNISDVIISRVTNSAVIMLAAPIYQDNEIAGVLIARRPGTALSDVTNAVRFGENGYAFLVNKEALAFFFGREIAHPIVLLSSVLERFAKYDLTFDQNNRALKYMSRKDEIGTITNSIAALQNNFVQILKDIDDQSNQVAAAAEEMTAISDQTSVAAEEIAKTIEELARGAGDQAEDTEQGAQKLMN